MNNDKKDIIYTAEDIEKYFSGRLSPARMYEIEKAALDDPFLAEAMEGYEGARDKNWKGTLAALHSQVADSGSEARVVSMHKPSGKWWKAAAAVLVIGAGATLTLLFNKNKTEETSNLPIAQNVKTLPDSNSSTNKTASPSQPEAGKNTASAPVKAEPVAVTTTRVKPQNEIKSTDRNTDLSYYKADSKPVQDSLKNIASIPSNAGRKDPAPSTPVISAPPPPVNTNVTSADDKLKDKNSGADKNKDAETFAKQIPALQKRRDQALNNSFNAQVVAADNSPLPFSNISIKNENFGTYSDVKGNFRLVSTDTVLAIEVKSMGYKPRTYLLKSNQPVNKIVLAEDELALNETIIESKETAKNQRSRRVIMLMDTVINVEPADGWDNYNTYVANNLEIPEDLDKKELHGEVELSFDVSKNGSISNIRVDKSLGPAYDEAAKRLIEQGPQWKIKKGRKTSAKVKVKF